MGAKAAVVMELDEQPDMFRGARSQTCVAADRELA